MMRSARLPIIRSNKAEWPTAPLWQSLAERVAENAPSIMNDRRRLSPISPAGTSVSRTAMA